MKQISKDNSFLLNNMFLRDKYKFSLIGHNMGLDETAIYSDEESYIFVLGKSHKPIWLWTIDNISNEKIYEIRDIIQYFCSKGFTSFACRESFYLHLEGECNCLNLDELSGCYICNYPIKPKTCSGYLDKAKEEDKTIITEMWYADCAQANPDDHISYELAKKFTERFLESGTFYVWRDNGKIVSMVDYTRIDGYAEVAHAYTIPEERGKGYMANAVYELTKIIIEKGFIPVLSTDYNYVPSNKCYQKIGYELDDKIVVFSSGSTLEKRMR